MKSAILFIAFAVAFCYEVTATHSESEAVVVEVKRQGKDENGQMRETILKVNFHVDVKEGVVHLNGHALNHSLVSAVHTRVQYDEYLNGVVLKHSRAKIQVRVMITENIDTVNKIRKLSVQEEIVEVDGEVVTQIHVKEIVLHVGEGNKEVKRTVTIISLTESKIHSIPREHDFHCYHRKHHGHGRLPHPPFRASHRDMELMRNVPVSHLRPAHFPDHPMRGNQEMIDDDDDEDFEHDDEDRHHDGRRRYGHHRHHGHFGKKFCSWFHRLPAGVRVFTVIATVFIALASLTCCVRCCCARRKAARKGAYALPSKDAPKVELYDDEEVDMAGPLPSKHPLDKVQLIVNS